MEMKPLLLDNMSYFLYEKEGYFEIQTSIQGVEDLKKYVLKTRNHKKGFFMIFTKNPHFYFLWEKKGSEKVDGVWRRNFAGNVPQLPISFYFDNSSKVRVDVWVLSKWCCLKDDFTIKWGKDSVSIVIDN